MFLLHDRFGPQRYDEDQKRDRDAEHNGRGKAAESTVRSQLSQIYAKAQVKSQPGLMATFIDNLIDPLVAPGIPPAT